MDIVRALHKRGIVVFDNIYSNEEINFFKDIFSKNVSYLSQGDDRRYGGAEGTVKCKYVDGRKIFELGLVDKVLNDNLKGIIYKIMPDAQVWKFYYIQTPPKQTRPHFIPKGGGIGDFHYDRKNLVYKDDRIDFIDFSIYLDDVDEGDGHYAFYPASPVKKPLGYEKTINCYGKAGTAICSRIDWYHSATPNMTNKPRHVLRVAVCKNFFDIDDYIEERKDISSYYKDKDKFISFIFGLDRRWYKEVTAPPVKYNENINCVSPETNSRINFSMFGKTTDANKDWNPGEIIENSIWQVTKNFIKRVLNKHN